MPLAPLAVPEATAISGEMEDNPAVALFVDRAKAVQPGFALDSSNVGAVSELVRELDGLPLAIELAAARAQMFPPETQLAQISKRFRLLARPASSGPRRQATLLGALDWSWELLQPWEQTALAQCSVFREGFDWQAVEAVVDLSAFPDAPWSVDVVQMLLEHSLLVSSQTPFGVRLSMLRSVAAYAEKRLSEVGPEARNDAESRHAAHYGTYGTQEFVDSTKRTGGKSRRMKLNVELANLIVATERSVANKWSEEAGPCCRAAVNVIDITGPYALGLSLLDSVLGLLTQESPEFLSLINAKGNFLNMTGRLEEACESFEIWLEAAKETGDPVEQGYALSGQIPTLNNLGLYDKAVSTGEEALKIFRQANLPTEEARVLVNMGVTERRRGHDQRAVGLNQNALDLFREVGDLVSASVVLGNLGNTYAMADRLEEAEDCYAQALAIHREVGNYGGEGRLTLNLARVKKYQGLRDEAQTLWHKALNILVETGQLYWQLQVHMELAKAHREDSQWDESATSHRRGLTIAREINDRDAQAVNLCGLGLVSREQGQLDEAKSMFSQAMEAAKTLEDPYQSGRIHNALGDLALKSDDRVKAREHYEQARTLHQESQHRPNYTRVLMNLGSLALKEGDEEQAVAHWIGAIRSLSKMERRLLGRNLLRDSKSRRDGLTPRLQDALRPHIEEIETLYT